MLCSFCSFIITPWNWNPQHMLHIYNLHFYFLYFLNLYIYLLYLFFNLIYLVSFFFIHCYYLFLRQYCRTKQIGLTTGMQWGPWLDILDLIGPILFSLVDLRNLEKVPWFVFRTGSKVQPKRTCLWHNSNLDAKQTRMKLL